MSHPEENEVTPTPEPTEGTPVFPTPEPPPFPTPEPHPQEPSARGKFWLEQQKKGRS